MSGDPPVAARFVARENRFVARVTLEADGPELRVYVPNTARLTDVLVPGARVLLEPTSRPSRRTAFTLTRVRDGAVWVSLEASRASSLLASYLEDHGGIAGLRPVTGIRREVTVGAHRFDLLLELGGGDEAVVEVKSLSRAVEGDAPLSATPSTRGVAHLEALGALTRAGRRAAVVFVVQRADVDRLVVGPQADPSWVEAVSTAAASGVDILAVACEVEPTSTTVSRKIEVVLPGERGER